MILIELLYNLSILVSFSIISGFIDKRWGRKSLTGKILQGLLFGLTSIIGMMNPFILTKGIIFDGRSIVISLCTLFFGPVSGGIAAMMAIIFRMSIGGSGVLMGTLVSSSSFLLGYLFHSKRNLTSSLGIVKLLVFGIIVHAAMMICVLSLPAKNIIETYQVISVTVMGAYPLVTILIGKILKDQEDNARYIEELSESESLFRVTLYSIGDAVITTDRQGRIKHLNTTAELLTGWNEDDARNENIEKVFKIVNEQTRKAVDNPVYKVLKEGNIIGLANSTILISKDEKEIPIADSGAPIKDETGEIIGAVLVFRDQTEERYARKILSESEQRFSIFMENFPGSVLIKDSEFRPIYSNRKFRELFPFDLWKAKTPYETFPSEIAKAMVDQDQKAFEDGYVCFEETWKDIAGKEHVLETHKFRIDLPGSKPNLGLIMLDITERKSAEEKLHQSEERYRLILSVASDYIFTTFITENGSPQLEWAGGAFEKISGYSVDEYMAIGGWRATVHPDDIDIDDRDMERLSKNKKVETEIRIIAKNGNIVWVKVYARPIWNYEKNKLVGIYGAVQNITDRKIMEQALQESEEKFSRAFHSSPDVILLISMTTKQVIEVNERLLNLAGFYPEEVIGKAAYDFNILANPSELYTYYNTLKEGGTVGNTETSIKTRTGKIKHVSISAEVIELKKGKYILAVIRDITERKKAEEALRESEKDYRQLFESESDAIFLIENSSGRILQANQAACALYEYDLSEILTLKNSNLSAEPEQTENVTHNTIIEPEKIVRIPLRFHRKKNGTIFPVEITGRFFLKNGNPVHIAAVRDITERKRAEEELKESEERYRNIFENHSAIKLLIDIDTGQIVDANKSALNYYGWTIDEIKKMKIHQINTLSAEAVQKEIVKARNSQVTHFEFKHRLANGSIRDVEVFSSRVDIKGKEYLHSIVHDITEKKKAEKQIILMSRSIEQSPVSIVITSPEGNIEYVNPKFTEVTGYSFEEIIGRNVPILRSGKQGKELVKNMWDAILSGKNWEGELHNEKKDGQLYWENAIISQIVDEHGNITHLVAVMEDITEKKKMIEDLIIAKNKAEEMNKVKSNFFASMSHELRTPLNGILGFSSLLQEELDEKPELKKMAEAVQRSGNRLLDTLNLILNISKLEAEKLDINLREMNIIPLLREVYNLFIPAAEKKKLLLEIYVENDEIFCSIDESLFVGIINNLVNNAIKYTYEGKVIIKASVENNSVIIKVIDSGIGIPEEMQELIWEEFRQVSEGFSRRFEGTGLGLTIAKKYTELLNGKIFVKSKLDVGSTFIVEFPLSAKEGEEYVPKITKQQTKDLNQQEVEKKYKLLYIEDDEDTIDVISLMMRDYFNLDTANNAEAALSKVNTQNYDAILMDVNLGRGIDGIQLTQIIHELPGYENKPIIAVTAFAMEGDREEFFAKGLTHYISKPFTRQELLKLLNSIFNLNKV